MSKHLVSVIIPCYNVAQCIHVCIRSLIAQTIGIESLQVILVDDASTDDTLQILYGYECQYPDNFLIIQYGENCRQGYARNLGIKYANADYITFVDADDFLAPNAIERMYEKQVETGCDCVFCSYCQVADGKAAFVRRTSSDVEEIYRILSHEDRAPILQTMGFWEYPWGILYGKDFVLKNNLFFAEHIVYEDAVWTGLLPFYVESYCILPDCLYYYVNWDQHDRFATHYEDWLSAQMILLHELKARGVYRQYREEVEVRFFKMYLGMPLVLFSQSDIQVPAGRLEEMRLTVLREIPDIAENTYLASGGNDFENMVISLVKKESISEAEWDSVLKTLKKN